MERDALLALGPKVAVAPSRGQEGQYDITATSWAGAINLETVAIEIRPKLLISRVLFLLSYAMNSIHWRASDFDFMEEDSVLEGIVPGFVSQVKKAMSLGVLQGYRTVEAALMTIKGRVRFNDQIGGRFGRFPPVEVRYDEYTEDIEENRLIKAALVRLGRMRIRSKSSRRALSAFDLLLQPVSLVEYDPSALPDIVFTRLNERYRPAIELAKLILKSTSFDLKHGKVRATTFLVDMNDVFENFVVTALREALEINEYAFPQGAKGKRFTLDQAGRVDLKPDISWWEEGRCLFVGDIKYKRISVPGIKHPDLYQLLAYTVASGLAQGLLIYAAGEDLQVKHEVVRIGKGLVVRTLHLVGSPEEILDQVGQIAMLIREQRKTAARYPQPQW
jgi:5-methylcytosine-specific restriction enzyme subunit McrC